ncbi:MAG: DUF4010 domain-containing protein [Candidatus Gracilibacteria bacterium]
MFSRLKNKELKSTLVFAVIAFVILPMLPNQAYGPFGAFNPYLIWLMVVFICGISFLSYVVIKIFGVKRGIGLTGFFAGLISSTALAFDFADQSKKNSGIVEPYVFAVVIASSAMFFRVLVEVVILSEELFAKIFWPMTAMGVVGILAALFLWLKKSDGKEVEQSIKKNIVGMKTPFSLANGLKFGLLFAAVLFVAHAALALLGDKGLYVTSVLSGLFDVDAITISIINLINEGGISLHSGAIGVILAAMVNTFTKAMIFVFLGNMKVAIKIIEVFIFILASGVVAIFFV